MSYFFNLVDGVEDNKVFSSVVLFEGFWLSMVVSVIIGFLGDGVFLGGHFSSVVSVKGFGSFVEDGGGVCISETDGDLGGDDVEEIDEVFEGDGSVDGSSSSTIVGLKLGKSSMTSGSSMLVTLGFGTSKQTVLGFLLDEVVSVIASLYACKIYCWACSIVVSPSGPRVGISNLFLFIALVCVNSTLDQILKALWCTFF